MASWDSDEEVKAAAPWDADEEVAPSGPSAGRSRVLGFSQGGTAGFADELGGLIGKLLLPKSNVRLGAAAIPAGRSAVALARGQKDSPDMAAVKQEVNATEAARPGNYQLVRDSMRQENAQAQEAHGGDFLAGNLAGGLATIPLLPGGQGNTLRQLVKTGAALGAAGGLGSSEADLTKGEFGRAAVDTGVGSLLGAGASVAGHGLGKALGAAPRLVRTMAARKVADIDETVARLGQKEAEAVTGSARSAAGTSATAAYKNATNIDEAIKAGAMTLDDLTPDQLALYRDLLRERAQKAARDIASDATRKATKGSEYAEAVATEAKRAEELAAQKLSKGELKSQVGARFKRYGLPAIGGAALAGATGNDSPMGLLSGAGLGALGGAGMRPMFQSLLRLSKQPVVQRPLWNSLEGLAGSASRAFPSAANRLATPLQRAMTPDLDDSLLPLLAEDDEDDLPGRQRSLAEALRRR